MSEVVFNDLNLAVNTDIKTVLINGKEVEVKQYLPITQKLAIIETLLEQCIDSTGFLNTIHLDVLANMYVVYTYTNIDFSEEDKEQYLTLYDKLESSGVFEIIISKIPETEYNFLIDSIDSIVEAYVKYANSFSGVVNALSAGNDINMDQISEIVKNISENDSLTLLKDLYEKYGK